MPAPKKRLNARQVETMKTPGRYPVDRNLFLAVGEHSKSWLFVFRSPEIRDAAGNGKVREMGLGSFRDLPSVGAVRNAAEAAWRDLREGRDPIVARAERAAAEARRAQEQLEKPRFGPFAAEISAAWAPSYRSAKHAAQIRSTLATYGAPIADKRVDEITVADVLACLEPIWVEKPETAGRVRGRIERVLDAARAKGHIVGIWQNPAGLAGLKSSLGSRKRLARGHHPAMPVDAVPAFVKHLRSTQSIAARALEFVILCASRSGEVRGARWSEFDLAAKLWTVPGVRTKAGREHRVPLSSRTLEVLEEAATWRRGADPSDLVFPGRVAAGAQRPLSDMTMAMHLKRIPASREFTVHGFRSSFRDWADERTGHSSAACERALGHVVRNDVEAAYRRTDLLDRRRLLMEDWAVFLSAS